MSVMTMTTALQFFLLLSSVCCAAFTVDDITTEDDKIAIVLKIVFNHLDINEDGKVDEKEADALEIVNECDNDQDKVISWDEANECFAKAWNLPDEIIQTARNLFSDVDTNGDGNIDIQEANETISHLKNNIVTRAKRNEL